MDTIKQINCRLIHLPLAGPTGGSGLTSIDVLEAELTTQSGVSGLGFSYVLGGPGDLVKQAAESLTQTCLVGQELGHPLPLWRRMSAQLNRTGRGIHYLAMAALDLATWDAYARRLEVPLGVALGGEMRAVPVYGSGGFRPSLSVKEHLKQVEHYRAQGVTAIKLRLTGQPSDAHLLKSVRNAVGTECHIMVDANEKATLESARWLATLCADYGVYWLEEPVSHREPGAFERLGRQSSVALATGEHLQGLPDFLPLVQSGAVTILQPDHAMVGGISEALRVTQLAEAHGLTVAPHFLPGLFIHLAAASPAVTWLEDFPLLESLFESSSQIHEGKILPPDMPGHGLRFRQSNLS